MAADSLDILALFGTRPEVIKLFPVIDRLRADPRFRVRVVSTSQHREMIADLLRLFALVPDFDLNVIRENQTLGDISTRTLAGLDPILRDQRPDLVLVQGDTTSAFIGALAAFYHKVAVGHVEAGLRSFDREHPFPEEVNRRLISVVADLHFAPTASAERHLLDEAIPAERVFVTGNTVIDALREIHGRGTRTLQRFVPDEALAGCRMLLMTAHRRESFGGHLAELCHAVKDVVARYPDVRVVYPVHLNPNVRRTVEPILGGEERIHLVEPLPYETFIEAMARSYLILTDSGGVQEEAPSLGKPVVVFRKVTERGEGLAQHGARIVGLSRRGVTEEVSRLLDDDEAYREMTRVRDLYGDGQASRRIIGAVLHHFGRGERPERFESS